MPERKITLTVVGKDLTKGVLSGISSGIGNILKLAGVGAAAVTGLAAGGVKLAIDVESAFAGVIKTTDGLADATGHLTAEGEAMKQQYRDLAQEVPTAVEDLMGIGELGGQLGVQKENLIDFTRTIAAMGEATNLTVEEAATEFAQFANVMGTSQQDFDRVGSSVVALGNNMATTESDVMAFASRIAGAGKIANLTEADVLGIASAFTSVGIAPEAGGTAVQKVLMSMNAAVVGNTGHVIDNSAAITKGTGRLKELESQLAIATQRMSEYTDKTKESTRMAAQARIDKLTAQIAAQRGEVEGLTAANGTMSDEGSKDLENFAKVTGMTAEEFREAWEKDAAGTFAAFVEGLGGAGDGAMEMLQDLGLEDQRLMRSFLSLGNAGDLVTQAIGMSNEAWTENTALTDEAASRYATTASQLSMMKNILKDVGVSIGDALLPFLRQALDAVRPFVTEFAQNLPGLLQTYVIPTLQTAGAAIGTFITSLQEGQMPLEAIQTALATFLPEDMMARIGEIVTKIQEFALAAATFAQQNGPELKAAIIGIGAALVAVSIATTIAGIVAALNPVTLIIAAIVVAVGALAAAWTGDWGGIRTTLTEVWTGTLQPALQQIVQWLQINVPAAIAVLSGFWTGTLLPAIQSVADFVAGTLVPLFASLANSLSAALGVAITAIAGLWQSVFQPAMQGVADFVTGTLMPFFSALADLLGAVLGVAITVVAGLWQNVWQPALQAVWAFMQDSIFPIFQAVGDFLAGAFTTTIQTLADLWTNTLQPAFSAVWAFIQNNLQPVFDKIASFIADSLIPAFSDASGIVKDSVIPGLGTLKGLLDDGKKAFEGIKGAIEKVTDVFSTLADKVKNFEPPAILTPGSPTPFEVGLRGIGDALLGASKGLLEFAKSIDPKAAKALNDVSDAFKDFTQVLNELSQASAAGGGPAGFMPDFGPMLDRFAIIAIAALDKIKHIQNVFSYDKIKELQKDASRIKSVLEAVTFDLSGIQVLELPDLDVWLWQFVQVVTFALNAIDTLHKQFGEEFLKRAVDIAGYIQGIIALIKPAIDALTALGEYAGLDSLDEQIQNLADRLGEVVPVLATTATSFSDLGLAAAAAIMQSAQAIVSFVKPAIEALKALFEWADTGDLSERAATFRDRVLGMINAMAQGAEGWITDGLDAASKFFTASNGVIGFLKPGIEGLKNLFDWEDQGDVSGKAVLFQERSLGMVNALADGATTWEAEGVTAASIWFKATESVVNFIKPGLDALKALFEWVDQGSVVDAAKGFGARIVELATELSTVPETSGLQITDAMTEFWDQVKNIIGIVGPGVDAFKKLADYTAIGNLPEQIKSFRTQIETAVIELAKMPQSLAAALGAAQGGVPGLIEAQNDPLAFLDPILAGLQSLSERIQPVFEAIKKALDAVKDMFKLANQDQDTESVGLTGALSFFGNMMTQLVTMLGEKATELEGGGLTAALRFETAAIAIAQAVRGGMNILTTMGEQGIASIPGVVTDWANQVQGGLNNIAGMTTMAPAMAGVPAEGGAAQGEAQGVTHTLALHITYKEPSGAFTEKVVNIALDRVDEYLGDLEV